MTTMASQITSLTVVYSIFYSDTDQRKHQCCASLAFVRGIHREPVNSPHKWPVTRKMFPFDDVIMRRTNWTLGWNETTQNRPKFYQFFYKLLHTPRSNFHNNSKASILPWLHPSVSCVYQYLCHSNMLVGLYRAIRRNRRFDVIITCLLRFVFAG